MKKLILIIAGLFVISGSVYSQASKYSNEFLALGVDARAFGMSNSVVATAMGATAGYWNPAGLTEAPTRLQLSLMHAEYFAGIAKYDYGAVAARMDPYSSAGLSFIRFAVDDIPNTTELIDANGNINYDKIKSFSAVDLALIFSYAKKMKIKGLRIGGNAKVIHRKVGDFADAWGFGLDFGVQYEMDKWRFGLLARDVTSTFNAWNYNLTDQMIDVYSVTGNELPENSLEITLPRLIVGAARNFRLSEKFNLLAEVDLDITTDGKRNVLVRSDLVSIDPHLGLELGFNNFVYLRAGLGNIQEEITIEGNDTYTLQPNIGLGIKIKDQISIDYALTDIGNASVALYSNIFSLKFNIKNNN